MKLITVRTQIRDVAARWRWQYPGQRSRGEVAIKLDALDVETATAEDVAEIIGNDGWCRTPSCDECGEVVSAVVQIGADLNYDSYPVRLCCSCVERALSMMFPNAPSKNEGEQNDTRRTRT